VRLEDKEALRDLVRRQHHYALTPEILRELDSSLSRGESAGSTGPDVLRPLSKVATPGAGGEDPRNLAPLVMMDD
jgi:essential nuclear protein 1